MEHDTESSQIAQATTASSFKCTACDLSFLKPAALRKHRRKEHAIEVHVMIKDDVGISVPRTDGKFRCPFVGCLKLYANVDTFNKHTVSNHNYKAVVGTREETDVDDTGVAKGLKRKHSALAFNPFSMSEGTQKILKLDSERRAYHTASSLDCDPVALHLSHDSLTDPLSLHGLFHVSDISNISTKIPFESSTLSSPVDCILQLHKPLHDVQSSNTRDAPTDNAVLFLKQTIRNSFIPNLMGKNGDYCEPTDELLQHLNYDFRLHPALLHAVAKLHTGALVVDKEVVFVMVAEAYGRAKATDIHAESNRKSISTPHNSHYGLLSAGVHEEADGGFSKRKLKIGSKTMNVLVTMSVRLRAEAQLDIGPETATTTHQIHPSTARIFYRATEIRQFLGTVSDPAKCRMPTSVTSLRQLVSGFGDPSTFLPFRAAHEEFDVDLMLPTTVFTLCDTPHSQGYGASAHSIGKLASRFLQCLALSMLLATPFCDFSTALHAYQTVSTVRDIQKDNDQKDSKTTKSWEILTCFVTKLEKLLERHKSLPPSVLGTELDFSSLAALAGPNVAASNQRIKEDVMNHLRDMYCKLEL